MAEEVVLMKGNEAIAHAAIRCGADGYFGYPITPQSEVLETLAELKPWETTGMVVLQAESEVAAINMVYGGAGSGKMVMTSSSSPGVSLKQEGNGSKHNHATAVFLYRFFLWLIGVPIFFDFLRIRISQRNSSSDRFL